MKYLKYAWYVFSGLAYLAVAVGIVSAASTRFETLMLAGLVQLYATVLYNFSVLGVVADVNNRAAFVRFQILAKAQDISRDDWGEFEEQGNELAESIKEYTPKVLIQRISNGVVSVYALFKIIQAAFFS